MDRTVAARAVASALLEVKGVILLANVYPTGTSLHLRMASKAEICIALGQHLRVYRTVRRVANDAAFTQRFMLEHERSRLIAMALGALLVAPRHGEATSWFHNLFAVRIVTLHAIHSAFDDRMVLRQIEFRVDLEMALKTGGRIFAGVNDEFASPAAALDMFAPRSVTRLAPARANHLRVFDMHSRVRAGRENPRVVRVTFSANFVADVFGAFNLGGRHDCASDRRARTQNRGNRDEKGQRQKADHPAALVIHE